jgi:SAM-dependent methyltransferase
MEVLESACREIENKRNSGSSTQWTQLDNAGVPWNGLWKPPQIVDCKVLEVGCGVGIYADALKKDSAKYQRQVFGIEPNPMGGAFKRRNGPRQLTVNILENGDTFEYATTLRKKYLNKTGDSYFDLLYSIEVFEHLPLNRHVDAVRFLAGLSRPGTKLIFGAGKPGQDGIGHIGNRGREEWAEILNNVGFVKNETATKEAAWLMTEFNHKRNTQVYIFQ